MNFTQAIEQAKESGRNIGHDELGNFIEVESELNEIQNLDDTSNIVSRPYRQYRLECAKKLIDALPEYFKEGWYLCDNLGKKLGSKELRLKSLEDTIDNTHTMLSRRIKDLDAELSKTKSSLEHLEYAHDVVTIWVCISLPILIIGVGLLFARCF